MRTLSPLRPAQCVYITLSTRTTSFFILSKISKISSLPFPLTSDTALPTFMFSFDHSHNWKILMTTWNHDNFIWIFFQRSDVMNVTGREWIYHSKLKVWTHTANSLRCRIYLVCVMWTVRADTPRQTLPWADNPHGQTTPWADASQADTSWAEPLPGRHPSRRRPLQRTVRILLKYILVNNK